MKQKLREAKITLIGAGSLGSYTGLLIALMGFNDITLIDYDFVEYHNRRNQLFREEDVGKPKVEALTNRMKNITGVTPKSKMAKAGRGTEFSGVVVVMVDTMRARSEIFQEIKYNPKVKLYIDARSGGDNALVFVVNPCDPDGVKKYEEYFYSDKEAADIPCSDQSTLPTVWNVASVIGRALNLWQGGWLPICEMILISYKELPGVDSQHLSV